jgi:glyceraldehyde-3-phosphate dehydrogenase (NADP+)
MIPSQGRPGGCILNRKPERLKPSIDFKKSKEISLGDHPMNAPEFLTHLYPQSGAIPAEFDLHEPVNQTEYLIGGELLQWHGPLQEVLSPVCVENEAGCRQVLIGCHPKLSGKESLEALAAASKAYDNGGGAWPTRPVQARIEALADFTSRMEQKKNEIVRLLMWEIGKSYQDSEKEFDRTITYMQDTIEAMKDLDRVSSRFVIQGDIVGQIRRAPLGVVLSMGPFNYPLNETFTTLIPALLMGNTVIFKPPKLGVLLFRPLLEAFREAFPPGVVNTIYGSGAEIIGPLMASGGVDALAFIGTSRVADAIKQQHPKPHHLRSILGLDAKNPAILLPDADLDLAVRECVLGSLTFNGQRCTALKILFVHTSICEAFLERFSAAVSSLKIGMPWEAGVSLTPLPEPGKPEYLSGLLEDALGQGARIINPNGGATKETFFFPALVYPVKAGMRLYMEEQFGPIVPVVPFEDIEEPMRYIVESNYGQQVSLFGKDPDRLARLIDPLVNQVCRVNLNSQCQRSPDTFPFTGRKDSAEGTLSVSDALRCFSIRTLVAARSDPLNKAIITDITRKNKSNFLTTNFIL